MSAPAKWLRALGNTGDGVYVVDGAQRILFWNKGAERLLGFTEAQVRGQHCYEVLHGRLRSGEPWCQAGCEVQRCVQRGTPVENFDLQVATQEGQDAWVNVSVIALPNQEKPLALHLLRDISREKHRERALRQVLRALRRYGLSPRPAEAGKRSGRSARLTRREREVMILLARGLSTRALARQLGISVYTARNHIQNVLHRLGAHTQAQAVSLALRNGLV